MLLLPVISKRKIVHKNSKFQTSNSGDSLTFDNNVNMMVRKMEKFGYQFNPIIWDMSSNFLKRQSTKTCHIHCFNRSPPTSECYIPL